MNRQNVELTVLNLIKEKLCSELFASLHDAHVWEINLLVCVEQLNICGLYQPYLGWQYITSGYTPSHGYSGLIETLGSHHDK